MSSMKLLGLGLFHEIQVYRGQAPADAVEFSGALRQHHNPNMVMLWSNPLVTNSPIYEFRVEDIVFAEELSSVSRPDGATVEMTRIWVRRGSVALRMETFLVETVPTSLD